MSSKEQGAYQVFFPKGEGPLGSQETVDRTDKDALALLRQPVPLHAVLLLLDREACTHAELEEQLPVKRTTLHYHMGKLERAGVVESWREGKERRYKLREGDRILALLVRYRPPDKLVEGFLEAWEALGLD